MKADTIEGLLKEYSQFLEEEKVDLLREEGRRLWRANNELKKEIAMGEKKVKELDELIARHKATLDLLAKPARTPIQKAEDLVGFYNKPEPAQECGCIDKAKLLDRLKVWMKTDNEEIKSALEEEDFTTAARYKASLTNHRHIEGLILRGKFDRAPCKPEPAPAETGEVIGFLPYYKDGESYIKVRLDDGTFAFFRGMPEEEWEREHTCRCSTANLVEQLRSRASVADGIDVTDLDADQLLEIGGNKPMTVIAVRKEENRS